MHVSLLESSSAGSGNWMRINHCTRPTHEAEPMPAPEKPLEAEPMPVPKNLLEDEPMTDPEKPPEAKPMSV